MKRIFYVVGGCLICSPVFAQLPAKITAGAGKALRPISTAASSLSRGAFAVRAAAGVSLPAASVKTSAAAMKVRPPAVESSRVERAVSRQIARYQNRIKPADWVRRAVKEGKISAHF